MTIEATLQSIESMMKAVLLIAQSGASAAHTFGEAAETSHAAANAHLAANLAVTAAKAPRKPKETPAADAALVAGKHVNLVDGDPEGTRYWVIEKHNTVYAQKPGDVDCSIEGAKIESAAYYLEKKAEFAKKSLIPPLAATPIADPAAASTPVATASTASSSVATPSFKEVTDELIKLSKDTRPGKGREALVGLLVKYLPGVDIGALKVPALAALGKNAEIMADVVALLAPDAEVEVDIFA